MLAQIIRSRRGIHLSPRHDAFLTLARAIVGQQISVKAAASVWARFELALGSVTPDTVFLARKSALRQCGLSERKAEYVADLARHFRERLIDVRRMPEMSDEAVVESLTAVRGVGRWTAEMFLIFHLLRPNVLPLDDVGLQRAVAKHYAAGRRVSARTIVRIAESWEPWRSVATWYLWRSLEPDPVSY